MTVQERIEVWTGELWETTPVYQLLLDSVNEVISDVDIDALNQLWVELTDSGTGVNLTNYRFIEARKVLQKAGYLSPSYRTNTRITDANPGVYSIGGLTYVIPDGGTILAALVPTIKLSSITVTNVPEGLMNLFVLRSTEKTLQHLMTKITQHVVETVTLPTAPTTPSAPSIAYIDATATAPGAISVAALPTSPVYTPPTLATRTTSPTVGTLDLTKKVDGVTALTAPTAPSDPVIAYVDATAATAAATTVAALGTAPTYTKPSFGGSLSLPTFPTLDLETKLDGVTANPLPTTPAAPSIAFSDSTAATTAATTVAALGTPPAYTKGAAAPAYTDWDTYFDGSAAEDPEMMAETMRKAGVEIQASHLLVQDELNEYQKELSVYQTDAQHKIEQARITAQEALANMRASTDVAIQNEAQTLSAAVANYDRVLAKFDKDIALYVADTQAQVQEYEAAFRKAFDPWIAQQREYTQQYGLDIQSELNEFNKELAAYQTDAQHKIQQAQITAQEALADMRASTDVGIQNEAKTLEALVVDYQLTLDLFQRKIALYQAEVEAVIQQYVRKIELSIRLQEVDITGDVARYQASVANARAAFEEDLSIFNAGVGRNALAAQIAREEANQTASQSTNVAVQNEARTLEAAISDQQAVLQKHAQDVQSYASQVRAVLDQQVADRDTRSEKLKMYAMDRDRVGRLYLAAKASYEVAFRRHRPINVRHVDY